MRVADLPLAWRTEFILHRFDAQVREDADAIVVTTPNAPTFYWGNFVLMPRAPRSAMPSCTIVPPSPTPK